MILSILFAIYFAGVVLSINYQLSKDYNLSLGLFLWALIESPIRMYKFVTSVISKVKGQ